jgi:hypothetical protein
LEHPQHRGGRPIVVQLTSEAIVFRHKHCRRRFTLPIATAFEFAIRRKKGDTLIVAMEEAAGRNGK